MQVELITAPSGSVADTTPQLLLGTTQKYVFLYDAQKQVTSVIPVSSVARLRIDRRRTVAAPSPTTQAGRQ